MIPIAQYSGSHAAVPALRLALVIGFSMSIGAYGPIGRGEANDRAGAASVVVADAKVLIRHRVELRSDGLIRFDISQRPDLMQMNEQECDAESRQPEMKCVFLVYEIQ